MYDEILPNLDAGGAAAIRDRLNRAGPEALRDGELVAVAVGIEPEAGAALAARYGPEELVGLDASTLARKGCGIGPSKAAAWVAAVELARRGLHRLGSVQPVISCPADALPYLGEIGQQDREHFLALYLNARNQLIRAETVSIGSLSASIVHPREVFLPAVTHVAASIILAHNHPSGHPTPSKEDIELTRRMVEAGGIMGMEILDHLIVTRDDFLSLKERGLM